MCLSTPKPVKTPPPPAPPPPEPEGNFAENADPLKDGVKRKADGTEALRVNRSTLSTRQRAGLQVLRKGADGGDGAGGGVGGGSSGGGGGPEAGPGGNGGV